MSNITWNQSHCFGGVAFKATIHGTQQAENLRGQVNAWLAQQHGSFEAGMDCGEYSVLGFVGSRSNDVLELAVYLNVPVHIADFQQTF